MIYFDTSFVVPLVRAEGTSDQVFRFVRGLAAGEPTISRWTLVEIASYVARDVRMGVLAPDLARDVRAELDELVAQSFIVIMPSARDYDLSTEYLHCYETGLRSGDALHLAIARNRGAVAIHSLDATMIRAGQLLGLPVSAAGITPH